MHGHARYEKCKIHKRKQHRAQHKWDFVKYKRFNIWLFCSFYCSVRMFVHVSKIHGMNFMQILNIECTVEKFYFLSEIAILFRVVILRILKPLSANQLVPIFAEICEIVFLYVRKAPSIEVTKSNVETL